MSKCFKEGEKNGDFPLIIFVFNDKIQILHIKADKLRNKMCGPLSGTQRGQINNTVKRDRGYATNLINFKYPDTVVDDGN